MEAKEFYAKLGKHCLSEKGCCKGCAFRQFCCKTAAEIDSRRVEKAEQLLEVFESGFLKRTDETQEQLPGFEIVLTGKLDTDVIDAIASSVKKAVVSAIRDNSEGSLV